VEFTFAWRRPAAMMALAALSAPAFAAEDDRPVTASLGGRLHLDFATFDNDNRGTPNKAQAGARSTVTMAGSHSHGWR